MKKMSFLNNVGKIFNDIPAHERRITTATCFTIARILITPFIVISIIFECWVLASFLFVIAGLTDMIDGICARFLHQKTLLGACLDPIADKFLMLSCFFTLACVDTSFFYIPAWFIVLVFTKEIVQIIGACWLYVYSGKVSIEPTALGKISTGTQIAFILLVCINRVIQLPSENVNYCMHLVVALMTVSCCQYAYIGMQIFKKSRSIAYE